MGDVKQLQHEISILKKRLNELQDEADEREISFQNEIDQYAEQAKKKLKTTTERFEKEIEDLKLSLTEAKGQQKTLQVAGKKLKLDLKEEMDRNIEQQGNYDDLKTKYDQLVNSFRELTVENDRLRSEILASIESDKATPVAEPLQNVSYYEELVNITQMNSQTGDIVPALAKDIDVTQPSPRIECDNYNRIFQYRQPPLHVKTLILGTATLRRIKNNIPLDMAYIACRADASSQAILNEVSNWVPSPSTKKIIFMFDEKDKDALETGKVSMKSITDNIEALLKITREKLKNASITVITPIRNGKMTESLSNMHSEITKLCEKEKVAVSNPNPHLAEAHIKQGDGKLALTKLGKDALAIFLKNFLRLIPPLMPASHRVTSQKTSHQQRNPTQKRHVKPRRPPLLPTPPLEPSWKWNQMDPSMRKSQNRTPIEVAHNIWPNPEIAKPQLQQRMTPPSQYHRQQVWPQHLSTAINQGSFKEHITSLPLILNQMHQTWDILNNYLPLMNMHNLQ